MPPDLAFPKLACPRLGTAYPGEVVLVAVQGFTLLQALVPFMMAEMPVPMFEANPTRAEPRIVTRVAIVESTMGVAGARLLAASTTNWTSPAVISAEENKLLNVADPPRMP